MGYDLHITRREDWFEDEQEAIQPGEWLDVVAQDPELRIEPGNIPFFAVWSGRSSYSETDGGWFYWSEGCVQTKNPDRAILAKMLELAAKLNAMVQGDEGEVYTRPEQLPESREVIRKPWWRFW